MVESLPLPDVPRGTARPVASPPRARSPLPRRWALGCCGARSLAASTRLGGGVYEVAPPSDEEDEELEVELLPTELLPPLE